MDWEQDRKLSVQSKVVALKSLYTKVVKIMQPLWIYLFFQSKYVA